MRRPTRASVGAGGAVILAGLAGSSRPALAFDVWGTGPLASSSVQVIADGELRYHQTGESLPGFEDEYPNLHDYVEQVQRVNLLLSKQGLSIGAQVDEVALFGNRYILDDVLERSVDVYDANHIVSPADDALVELEKLYVQRRFSRVELTVGDAYASFGRGLALNIVKNTDIDVDTSIRGVKSIFRFGSVDITAVSGLTNAQQISQDNPNLDIDRDVPHMVTGLRVVDYAVGPAQVGMHGVMYTFGRTLDESTALVRYEQPLDAVVTGATVDLPGLAGIDWYAEGDLFGYRSLELAGGDEPLQGYGTYASASAYPGKAVVLVEAKATKNTEVLNGFAVGDAWELATVPTLEYERVINEDSSSAVNSNDIKGARVRLDYAARPGVFTPYVAVAGFRDLDVAGSHFNQSPETIGHAVTGLQWFDDDRVVQFNAGFRADVRDDSAEGADRLAHLDAEWHQPLFGEEALEIAVDIQQFWWGVNAAGQADFLQSSNTVAWHRGEKLVLLVYQDWTNNPLISSEGNVTDDLYLAGEVQWKPGSNSSIRAFYGAYKAGIRCAGGQCRNLPGFEGGRLSYNATF